MRFLPAVPWSPKPGTVPGRDRVPFFRAVDDSWPFRRVMHTGGGDGGGEIFA